MMFQLNNNRRGGGGGDVWSSNFVAKKFKTVSHKMFQKQSKTCSMNDVELKL